MTNREKYNSIISKVQTRQITVDRSMELLGELYVDILFDDDGTIAPNDVDCTAIKLAIIDGAEHMKMPERVERRRRVW